MGYPSRARVTDTKSRNPILAASRAPTQGVFGPQLRAAIACFCPGFGRRLINAPAWLCLSLSRGRLWSQEFFDAFDYRPRRRIDARDQFLHVLARRGRKIGLYFGRLGAE